MDAKLNSLPAIDDFEKAYLLLQYAHENGFRSASIPDLYNWLNLKLQISGIDMAPVPPGSELPTPPSDEQRRINPVSAGSYTWNGNTYTVPEGYTGTLFWNGSSWSLTTQELPKNDLADGFGESVEAAATQRLVTALRDRIDEVDDEISTISNRLNDQQVLGFNNMETYTGGIVSIGNLYVNRTKIANIDGKAVKLSIWVSNGTGDFNLVHLRRSGANYNNIATYLLTASAITNPVDIDLSSLDIDVMKGDAFGYQAISEDYARARVRGSMPEWSHLSVEPDGGGNWSIPATNIETPGSNNVGILMDVFVEGDFIGDTKNQLADLTLKTDEIPNINNRLGDAENNINSIDLSLNDTIVYDSGNFEGNRFWNLNLNVGDVAPTSSLGLAGWMFLPVIPINKGDKITLRTVGGNNARAYAVTDTGRVVKILAAEMENTLLTPFVHTADEDGFLYVNCNSVNENDFLLYIQRFKLDDLETRVNVLESNEYYVPNLKNNPLPKKPESLKILGIGNSFTASGMQYLPNLLSTSGIDNVYLARLYFGSCTLEMHVDFLTNETETYRYDTCAQGATSWTEVAVNTYNGMDALTETDWDIIVIQQESCNSGQYETFNPYLSQLIDLIKVHCPNAGVTIAWQQTWAYATSSVRSCFSNYGFDQNVMFNNIVEATKRVVAADGIDIVIPSGVAIQSLRGSFLNNPPDDLTSDGYHLATGVPTYTQACTWFQSLISPVFGNTILENSFRPSGAIPVNNENYKTCQLAALYACSRRFEITPL